MDRTDSFTRDLISEAIRSLIDDIAREHFDAATQEHQLTSRICGALEAKFSTAWFSNRRVRVITQEFPDKGPGSAEKKTGVDLYVGIEIDGPDPVSKGLLVQSKWKETARSGAEHRRLVGQCEQMTARSPASYVWLYGPEGVEVVPAGEVVSSTISPPESLGSRKISELFRNVLDCFEGDPAIGLPRGLSGSATRRALKAMIAELAARSGILISIGSTREPEPYEPIDWNPEA